MNNQELADKLRRRRDELEYSQEYMGAKMGMTQSGYSWIENGKTRITPSLLKELKSIENFEHFDEPSAGEMTNNSPFTTLADSWRWGKPLLYLTVLTVSVLILEKGFSIIDEIYEGWTGDTNGNSDVMGAFALIYFLSGVGFTYWFVFRMRWKKYQWKTAQTRVMNLHE